MKHHLIKAVILSVMLLFCMAIQAQNISCNQLKGTVISSVDKKPLIGVNVLLLPLHIGCVTNEYGNFTLSQLPQGDYTLILSYIGYKTEKINVSISSAEPKRRTYLMTPTTTQLSEVIITQKSEARKLREQAMPVTVISMNQLQGTASSIKDILSKTVGITIRNSGGEGSASRISLRGLEGKRIGFFIDETPLNDQSDFIDLNDIPIDLIDRIEIYKGIVPAKLGGSAMGGAVNIVIKEYPPRYADFSITQESFHTNKLQSVLKRNFKKQGILCGIGGAYTNAKNDYEMESPFVKDLHIKRNHDHFKKIMLGGSIKAYKWWFDEVEFEPVFLSTYRELQGIKTDIKKAHTQSKMYLLNNKLKKENFLIEGLDMEFNNALAYTQYSLTDTAKVWYDWSGNKYPTPSYIGGELTDNRYASNSDNRKFTWFSKLNLTYLIDQHHSINFNSMFSLANGYPKDDMKLKSLGKKIDFDSKMRNWTIGFTYDYRTYNDKLLNSLTIRHYNYQMKTQSLDIYSSLPPEKIHLHQADWGINDAIRYRFTPNFMGKCAIGYDVRIPSEEELLGNGYTISPSEKLAPERNTSINLGILYDLTGKSNSNLQIEVNTFYMHVIHMIRYVKGILGAQYQNFGEMRSMGMELETKADILPFLYGYGNFTYQDLRDVRKYEENSSLPNPSKGKRIPNIPYLLANAGIELHQENLFGGKGQNSRLMVDASYVHEYYYDFELTKQEKRRIPTSFTIDVGVEHSFMHQSLFLSAKIRNITNAKVLSEFNRPLPGRSWAVKLRYVFK